MDYAHTVRAASVWYQRGCVRTFSFSLVFSGEQRATSAPPPSPAPPSRLAALTPLRRRWIPLHLLRHRRQIWAEGPAPNCCRQPDPPLAPSRRRRPPDVVIPVGSGLFPLAPDGAGEDGSSRSGELFPSFTDPMVSPLPLARIRRRLRREGLDPATSSSPARIPSSLSAPLTLIRGRRRREGPDPVVSTVVAASLPPPLLHAWPVHRTLPSPSSPG
jgi:hypothetical protein